MDSGWVNRQGWVMRASQLFVTGCVRPLTSTGQIDKGAQQAWRKRANVWVVKGSYRVKQRNTKGRRS